VNPQQWVALLELAANVTLTAIPVTSAFAPLAAALEAGINPLIASIQAGNTKTQDILAGYASMIALIQTLKAETGLDPAVLTKLDEYLTAAQNGTVAALAANTKGYDPSQLTPVTPIA
jgi:hypothetical protein